MAGITELTVVKRDDGTTILRPVGRMDIDGTDQIDLRLNVAAGEDGALLIADLSSVDFLASIGIGTFIRMAKTVRQRRGNLVLLHPQPVVRLVLEKTRVTEVIAVCDTLEDALRAVREVPSGVGKTL